MASPHPLLSTGTISRVITDCRLSDAQRGSLKGRGIAVDKIAENGIR